MSSRYYFGIILVFLGVGLMLDRMGFVQFGGIISTFWPMILILIGVLNLVKRSVSVVAGVLITFLGVYFQINRLEAVYDIAILPEKFSSYFFPALLIIVGVSILLKKVKHDVPRSEPVKEDDTINDFALLSGVTNINTSKNFEGGKVSAIFGGAEINLSQATLSDKGANLELNAVFGGIEIRVPDNWKVTVTGMPILGGWENKTRCSHQDADSQPILRVKCFAAFGGVEIRN